MHVLMLEHSSTDFNQAFVFFLKVVVFKLVFLYYSFLIILYYCNYFAESL